MNGGLGARAIAAWWVLSGVCGCSPSAPQSAPPASATTARIPPEAIQRVMRAAYDQFRHCYEPGLGRNAQLTGRVVLRFVIALDGHVSKANATDATTMPDQVVVSCIADSLHGLVFPQPEGGIVTVVYPIELSPG